MKVRKQNRFWKIAKSFYGDSHATIRFLPQPEDEDDAWVKYHQHFFQTASGRMFSEPCPTSIGEECVICELHDELNCGDDEERGHAKRIQKRDRWISNIYIVNDPNNLKNNGQVKLYDYGKTVFDHIQHALSPVQGDSSWNPFDFWKGTDLVLRYEMNSQPLWACYEESVWAPPSQLKGTDDELEMIWKKEESLQQFLEPEYYMDNGYLWNKYSQYMEF